MRFLFDESADARLAAYLQTIGHEVTTVVRHHTPGSLDPHVLTIALAERRILVTKDSDFGNLVVRHGLPHADVVFFRIGNDVDVASKVERLNHVLTNHTDDLNRRCFLTVTLRRIRVRLP